MAWAAMRDNEQVIVRRHAFKAEIRTTLNHVFQGPPKATGRRRNIPETLNPKT